MTIHDSRRPGSGDDLQSLQASERRLRALIEHGCASSVTRKKSWPRAASST
jgi:hypothetical protein